MRDPAGSDAEGSKRPDVLISTSGTKDPARSLGTAHYSYGFAADAFRSMLADEGVPTTLIAEPEQFKTARFASVHGMSDAPTLHLIFRSSENIRPIPGVYNVACFAWEFEALKANGLPEEATVHDQVGMLGACDEVWVPCEYTRQVLNNHGLERVHVVPAPVHVKQEERGDRRDRFASLALRESVPLVSLSSGDEAAFGRLARTYSAPLIDQPRVRSAVENGGPIFLTVCNPYDKRKNLASLIEGFLMAAENHPDAVLIVKLVTSGQFESPVGYLFHQVRVLFGIPHCFHEDGVVLFSSFLSREEMSDLYSSADFYLSTSLGEGQNLPLIEAMAHGCVPVSVRNTAMADYIDQDNAVVIRERRYSGLVSGLASDVAGVRVRMPFSDRFAVAEAIQTALGLSPAQRLAKAAAAARTVQERYSRAAIMSRVRQRLDDALPGVSFS